MGSGDSHSDCGTDGGTDRTGNNLVHGLRTILKSHTEIHVKTSHRDAGFSHTETQRPQSDAQRIILRVIFRVLRVKNSVTLCDSV